MGNKEGRTALGPRRAIVAHSAGASFHKARYSSPPSGGAVPRAGPVSFDSGPSIRASFQGQFMEYKRTAELHFASPGCYAARLDRA